MRLIENQKSIFSSPSPKRLKSDLSSPTIKEFVVNDKSFFLNIEHLSAHSSYFSAMFQTGFKEKDSEKIELKEIGSANDFEDILPLISQQILPNRMFPFDIFMNKNCNL